MIDRLNQRQRILIADDSPTLVDLLKAVLGDEHDLIVAVEGEATLKLAHQALPDLILLDVLMPGIDGYEVCRQLKADDRTRHIPIIFITGLDKFEDERYCLELGAIDFISKPIMAEIVSLRVRNQLELKRYRDFLEDLSLLDGLTGIGNRRRFDDSYDLECRRARRQGTPLSVMMLDVDKFKAFNDQFGHAMGDECLRQVARTIESIVRRPGDIVARYGGEEFAVILPATDHEGAVIIAERIRAAVEKLVLPLPQSVAAPHVTISVGLGTGRPGEHELGASLLAEADKRLYEAKRGGRNRVCAKD